MPTIDKISRIYWLIEDCKRYGTLPFAGLARAGFIAVQMLQSFVEVGVLTTEEAATFMASVDTSGRASGRILRDCRRRTSSHAMATYGREPMTSSRPATTRHPICISTGRVRDRPRPRRRASRSRLSSCATSSSCSRNMSWTSTY